MLTDYPVQWQTPEVQQTLKLLGSIWKPTDIEKIVQNAGLPGADVAWDRPASGIWRSVFQVAAMNEEVDALLDSVIAAVPALKVPLSELRANDGNVISSAPPLSDPDVHAFDSPNWKNFSADGKEEAVIVRGQPTFLDVSFLEVALDRARSVCRLATRFPGAGSGTGFRVGPRHILTNHHVLFDHQDNDRRIESADAWFNYELDASGREKPISYVSCDPDKIVADREEDWALIETSEPIPDQFPALSLTGAPDPKVDDRVCIIQHPYGEMKKIALQHNLVRAVEPRIIQYWTDTDEGSSGSPVFDEHWRIVGLHHFSVTVADDSSSNVRNQGRRITKVVERMRDLDVDPVVWR